MISKSAVTEYLNRRLRDSALLKNASEAFIDRKINALVPKPKFHTQPRFHQKVAFLLGCRYSRYLHLLDPGTGKSKVCLDLFQRAKDIHPSDQPPLRALVVVPGVSNIDQWEDQVRIHAPNLTTQGINGTGENERLGQLNADVDIVIVTYMGLLSLCCDYVRKRHPKNPTKQGKRALEASPQIIKDRICSRFSFFCMDECDFIGNKDSMSYSVCKAISWAESTIYCYGLTGTPFGKTPHELWPQFHVVDKGETFGPTLSIFREAFFTKKFGFFGGCEYLFNKRMKDDVSKMMRNRSIRYSEEECVDLPEEVTIKRPVSFPAETWRYYDKLIEEIDTSHKGGYQLLKNTFIRLRTICSGYLVVKDKEGNRHEIRFKENPKLNDLLQFLSEIHPEDKVVVFLEYIRSGEIVCEAMAKAKIKFVRLFSGTPKKENPVGKFTSDPSIRVLVGSSAAARGLNLQIAKFSWWFESPCSPKIKAQEKRRVRRMGQTKRTFLVESFIRGSCEETLLHCLARDKNLFDMIVNGRLKSKDLRRKNK